ncbi:conserved Plasmodium protein, unknown function [Plasmodium malariae]|uniref:Uncharacterized protein n=1 Tax=Plasmodium malariae TaxID=5858 RepID=A0A1D3PAC7_PLAMA|nr:conserved Plasmodium protein, unknown function [Plasmodium malariae]SCN12196.1 conserved Plasmodium protein, unknown function [Plasmodium malariae]
MFNVYDQNDHSCKRTQKKKKIKYQKNTWFFLFFFSISVILYFSSGSFVVFAKNVNKNDVTNGLINNNNKHISDNKNVGDSKKRKKKREDELITVNTSPTNSNISYDSNSNINSNTSSNTNSNTNGNTNSNTSSNTNSNTNGNTNSNTNSNINSNINSNTNGNINEEIRRDLLMDTFNIKKFEDDAYKLNFLEGGLMDSANVIKNSSFIFDAVKYLFKGIKEGHLKPPDLKDTPGLRSEMDNNAGEIKRLIIIKIIKCAAVLMLLYIIVRLIFSFFKKLFNLIFVFLFKTIKFCCCGGK